jgi:thiamine biosynthesis lipoprotein
MGTVVSFDLRDAVPGPALAAAVRWLHWVDSVFSTYRPDSYVSRLNRGETRLEDCPAEVAEVLELCQQAAKSTDGFFTAFPSGRLDPSGLVKGWSVQRASEALAAAGSHRHAVNGAGDIQFVGQPAPGVPWRVGITDPCLRGQLAAVVPRPGGAIATSGVAERGHHVVNPRTGRAAIHWASVTVLHDRLVDADVMATAAVAMGEAAPGWIETVPGTEALFIDRRGGFRLSSGFPRQRGADDSRQLGGAT